MKFSTALFSAGLVALAAAQSTTVTSEIPKTSTTICLEACDESDVKCRAACLGVPRPNEGDIADNLECAMACDQGSGSPEDTEAYGQCLLKCEGSFFLPTTTTRSGAAPTGSGAAPTGSGAGGSGSDDDNEGGDDSTDEEGGAGGAGGNTTNPVENDEGAASIVTVGTSVVGMVAIIAAALAL